MRPVTLSILLSSVVLFGAGCSSFVPLVSPRIAEPIEQTQGRLPLTQYGGFGEIPNVPSPTLRPGFRGSVRITAEFPTLPSDITVLRVKTGRPSATQIRNIASSFDLPGGIIGAQPNGHELALEWKDDQGITWTTKASERRIDFVDETKPLTTLTVSSWIENSVAIESALAFLEGHGVNTKRYGAPYVEPDWMAWWKTETARGRCMSSRTIASIRTLSASMAWLETGVPTLPNMSDTADCVSPEFPSRIIVRLSAMQDGQTILHGDGSPHHAATLLVDATTGEVTSGWLTVPVDPDRSDYPALSIDEAREQMARGGQGGTPNGEVTIETITFEWYAIQDGRTPRTDYLYPALVGHGSIQYADKTTSPYRIVVPLVK